jgi:hypothetical protein
MHQLALRIAEVKTGRSLTFFSVSPFRPGFLQIKMFKVLADVHMRTYRIP